MTTPSMSCPSGGSFYACGDGSRFVGCCGVNPCSGQGCAAGNLATTSFEASQYGQIPDEECSAGSFYTCTAGSTPFWGCCKSNPCGGSGCPRNDLAGAFLSNNANTANPYLEAYNSTFGQGASSSPAATPSATAIVISVVSQSTLSITSVSSSTSVGSTSLITSGSSTLSTSVTGTEASATQATSSAALPTAQQSSGSSNNAGAIAGGVVGGFAVLAALILGVIYLLRRRNKHDGTPGGEGGGHGQVEVQQHEVLGMTRAGEVKQSSPTMYSHPGSPQPPYSPGPPSYTTETHRNGHMSYELPATQQFEMDSGQSYHPYRAERE